jgi:hypothetical protein
MWNREGGTGFFLSWAGNLYARAFEGEKSCKFLEFFQSVFLLEKFFSVNGDQCKAGYSNFTYRPFTLEVILLLLLQSKNVNSKPYWNYKNFSGNTEDWHEVEFKIYGQMVLSCFSKKGKRVSFFIEFFRKKEENVILDQFLLPKKGLK